MLTKGDLSAIKTIVKDEVRTIVKDEVKTSVKSEMKVAKKEIISEVTTQVTTEVVSQVKILIQENTDQLVELITAGFNAQQTGFDNHEHRIVRLEKVAFSTS